MGRGRGIPGPVDCTSTSLKSIPQSTLPPLLAWFTEIASKLVSLLTVPLTSSSSFPFLVVSSSYMAAMSIPSPHSETFQGSLLARQPLQMHCLHFPPTTTPAATPLVPELWVK